MEEIKLPQMGQSVEEAPIVQWLKKEGDTLRVGEPIFTIQTDKAEIECESTAAGVLRKILVEEDVEVPVLTVVALVGTADEPLPDLSKYKLAAVPAAPSELPATGPAAEASQQAPRAAAPKTTESFASPRARATAVKMHVKAKKLNGSGPGGRVLEEDVLAFVEKQRGVQMSPTARRIAYAEGLDAAAAAGTGPRGKVMKADVAQALDTRLAAAAAGLGESVPLTPMRRIIAQRMAESKFSAPHYYVTVEVDMANAVAFRTSTPAFKPSFNDLVMRATARAIQDYPTVNARWLGDAIETVPDINLGFAVALESGLVVPVVRSMQRRSLQDISTECKALAEKARTGKLMPDDYAGNTFTISNLGIFGVDHFTAIINSPDSAILAIGQIKERPVVINGGIYVRPIMKMTLSSDHRVIDGAIAAQFMGRLKQILEEADF